MPNVPLPKNTDVDLYAESGIAAGTQITVTNIGPGDVRLSESDTGLLDDHITLAPYEQAINKTTDPGAWAKSTTGGGVNVKEA